jgi:uncharacterized membrane protein
MCAARQGKLQPSPIAQYCAIGFIVAGVTVFLAVAPRWFPQQPLVAGLVGGVCAVFGAGIGKLIEAARRS